MKYCKNEDASTKLLLPSIKNRVMSIDTFRGMDLCLMIFANYGGGQYWAKLIHATWDGITLADFAFPLWSSCFIFMSSFIFIQGISLRLSITSNFDRFLREGSTPFKATLRCTWKVGSVSLLKTSVSNVLLSFTSLLGWLINQPVLIQFDISEVLCVYLFLSSSRLFFCLWFCKLSRSSLYASLPEEGWFYFTMEST